MKLNGTYMPEEKKFRIRIKNCDLLVNCAGPFDNERELMEYAEKNGQPLFAYYEGTEKEAYILVYENGIYDVVVES